MCCNNTPDMYVMWTNMADRRHTHNNVAVHDMTCACACRGHRAALQSTGVQQRLEQAFTRTEHQAPSMRHETAHRSRTQKLARGGPRPRMHRQKEARTEGGALRGHTAACTGARVHRCTSASASTFTSAYASAYACMAAKTSAQPAMMHDEPHIGVAQGAGGLVRLRHADSERL